MLEECTIALGKPSLTGGELVLTCENLCFVNSVILSINYLYDLMLVYVHWYEFVSYQCVCESCDLAYRD